MLFRLDDALLDRAQNRSERVQDAVGLSCYWQARLCHIVAFGSVALVASRISSEVVPVVGAVLCFASMYCFMVWGWYTALQQYYDEGPDTAHWITLLWRSLAHTRLMNLLMIAGVPVWVAVRHDGHGVLALSFGASLCFWTSAQYLQCCIPKRPSKSALRRKAEAVYRRMVAQPTPAPSPA